MGQVNILNSNLKSIILEFYKDIINRFSWRINIISLTGSIANNEATFIKIGKNTPALLSDIEIFLSLKFWFPFQSRKLSMLQKKAHKKYQIKFSIILIPRFLLKKQMTLQFFDVYNNSKLIYGNKSELEKIPAKFLQKIPKWEGIRLLLNRSIELLEYSEIMISNKTNPKLLKKFIYSCIKALLACCESILLFFNDYKFTYQQRLNVFIKNVNSKYNQFQSKIPNLSYYIEFATKFKQNPFEIEDHMDLWFKTKDVIFKTLEIYIKNYLKIDGSIFKQMDHLPLLLTHKISRNLYYILNLFLNRYFFFNFKILKTPIQFILFKSALYLLSAIEPNFRLKQNFIQLCKKNLALIFPLKKLEMCNEIDQFKFLKTACISSWNLMPQYIISKNN